MSLEFDQSNPLRLKRKKLAEDSKDEELSEAEEEEDLLGQDIEGNQRRKKRQRKGIDVTQYADDSSDEDYDGRETPGKDGKKENDGDGSDSDMFGSEDDEHEDVQDSIVKADKKESRIQFLDIEEFEKANELGESEPPVIASSASDEDGEEEEEEEVRNTMEYYNNPEATRKEKKIPRAEPKLDAFNLKNEQNEGRFDIDGNFIPVVNSDNEENNNDEWLLNVKKKDIKRAKIAQEERERQEIDRKLEKQVLSTEDLLFRLITLLEPVESPLEALQRLNRNKPKHKKRGKVIKTDEELQKETQVVEITECAESLIEKGFKNVYELEKEELMLKYREESGKNYVKPKVEIESLQEQNDGEDTAKWQFRWIGDTQVHGPYTLKEMVYWKDNYFNGGAEVRKVSEKEFQHIDAVTFRS